MHVSLDRALGFVLLGISGVVFVGSWKLASGPAGYGGALPMGLSILLGLLSLLLLAGTFVRPKRDRGEPALQHAAQPLAPSTPRTGAALGLITMLVLYTALFDFLGYVPTTAIFGVVYLRFFHGVTWRVSALTTIVMVGVAYLLFDRLLDVTLPLGSVFSVF